MRLKHVYIHSGLNAKEAEKVINDALENLVDDETDVNYELKIESTVNLGPVSQTRYTVVIHLFDVTPLMEFDDDDYELREEE